MHIITYNNRVCNYRYGGFFMNLSSINSFITAAELSLAEKGIESAKVILTGFVVVFAVLFLLIGIIMLFGFVIEKAQTAAAERKNKKLKESVETNEASAPAQPEKTSVQAQTADDGVPEEVVAVISAAVSSMYGSSQKVRVKSIKKSNSGRSAWASAGVFDNTRPF